VTEVPPVKNQYPTFGLYREATIEPTADLNLLDELFIVLGPKLETKERDKSDSSTPPPAPTPIPAPATSTPMDANAPPK